MRNRYIVELTFGEQFPVYYGVFHTHAKAQQVADMIEHWVRKYEVDGYAMAAQVVEVEDVPKKRDLIAFLMNEMGAERVRP